MLYKSYRELCRLRTFEERFAYLKMNGVVGQATFGYDRYLNQILYTSDEWQRVRLQIILRDAGCDLGILDREILSKVIVHHINPITLDEIHDRSDNIFNFDNLICTSHATHNAIHFGDESLLITLPPDRKKGDTTPWN